MDADDSSSPGGRAESRATFDVVASRTFDAPVERVWRAWSESDEVRRWWGPQGFTCPLAEVDLRVGGRTLVAMRAPDGLGGGEMRSSWTFSEVVPLERIVYTFRFLDADGRPVSPSALGLPPGIPDEGRHVVTFADLGDGRCEMTMVEHGYTTEQARDLSGAGLDECLDKMSATFT